MDETCKFKKSFEDALRAFVSTLSDVVATEDGNWTIKGFIDTYKNIYTISSDTEIVSKILEIHLFPQILEFARRYGYKVVLADKQNWYPDLTFISEENESIKFAVDIKTTFRRNGKTAGFTLGSHGSYFKERDKSKNIQLPYNEYTAHYCLGIIYSRNESQDESEQLNIYGASEINAKQTMVGYRKVTTVKELKSITSVIKDFDFFVAEKWKIASDRQGSGNTANIGSINDIDDLKEGKGVFSFLGESFFDELRRSDSDKGWKAKENQKYQGLPGI
ncbi:type II restriction endonuclease [uncultured Fibrobacter sp.]|uniref:type II restriction endonuclease n=1 Tax=uncultured Fibrobacter sp. TaxID=261512 RepID=UPI002599D8AF|nr:type II restriction endonuclease [uncultured Fibrobacter sp.]